MAARTTRQKARERVIKSFMESLDRIIPSEEAVPLRGKTFLDWERQADMMRKAVLPTLLQERGALDETAVVEAGACGKCPRCGSDRLYLDHGGHEAQKEVISPHGPVVIAKHQCRCRASGRSFSPQDCGRYQSRDKDPETQSRRREEKVLTISSYLKGDGKEKEEGGRPPVKLVMTHMATAQSVKQFGPLARVEAERRGLRQAEEVIALGDGGNWIDPLLTQYFHVMARIIDWYHAVHRLG